MKMGNKVQGFAKISQLIVWQTVRAHQHLCSFLSGALTAELYFLGPFVFWIPGPNSNMCVFGVEELPIQHQANSWTPVGGPKMQLNSDTLLRDSIRFHR